MRRPQKPFSVEVKRARKGAASGAPVFISKPTPLDTLKAESPIVAPPEREKPRRRILEAIEPDLPLPIDNETGDLDGASPRAESLKPRRGRPRKIAGAPEAPAARGKSSVRVKSAVRVKSGARSDNSNVFAATRRDAFVSIEPTPVYVAPNPQEANRAAPKPARPNNHVGHVNHAGRVEAASDLPRGERWKRRLPKVLW